jgi:hypothetical protein
MFLACMLHAIASGATPELNPTAEFDIYVGNLPAGFDVVPPGNFTTADAEALCAKLVACAG